MARFIDPRVDWAFKRIFGSEDTKECLITFLNGLFEDELVIKDVTFAKTENLACAPMTVVWSSMYIASQTRASMSSSRCRRKNRNTLPTGHCITRHVPLCSRAFVESGTITWLQSIRYVSWISCRIVRC